MQALLGRDSHVSCLRHGDEVAQMSEFHGDTDTYEVWL
jgi:hypothetical protein